MNIISQDSIKSILERQVLHGYAIKEKGLDMISDYPYKEDDYEAIKNIATDILRKSNYKFDSDNDFQKKIKSIFNFENNNVDINFLVEYPCQLKKKSYQLDGNYVISNNNPIFIDVKNKIILEALFIPELLDYKSSFPEIYQRESSLEKEKNINGNVIEIIKWNNVKDLNEIRFNNTQKLINRNKYLFNDSKASFAWLQFNDKLFLESLIKTFGYVKDKDLLEWYIKRNSIDKYKNNLEEYLKVFYVKTCDDKFNIHEEVFDYMNKNPKKYSQEISSVLESIRVDKLNFENLSFEQKAKLIAYLLYFGEKHKEETGMTFDFMGTFYEGSSDELRKGYDEEFKKQSYYNLPAFKQYWEDAKNFGEGIGLDM